MNTSLSSVCMGAGEGGGEMLGSIVYHRTMQHTTPHQQLRVLVGSLLRLCVVGLLAPSVLHAEVPNYGTYQLQARGNIVDGYNLPPGSSFNSGTPALNDAAQVTFRLLVVGGTGNAGLWHGRDGQGTVVYHAPADRLLTDPSINESGDTVFEQNYDFQSEGVFLYDAESGASQVAVPVGGPFGIDGFASPQINNAGEIGFRADLGAVQAFIRDDAGTQTQYVVEGGPIAFLFVPRFNGASQFAAKVRLGSTSESSPDEIRRYEAGGTFTTIASDDDADPESPYVGIQNGVGMSDNGWVAFVANLASGSGVFLSDGVTTRTIATSADPEVSSIDFFAPAVNDEGLVAFRAFDESGLRAIFVGDGTTLRRVVTEHDLVPTDRGEGRIDQHDSSPVFGGSVDINARGEVVFAASLTPAGNNQIEWGSGIFVAYAEQDPASAPDPHASGLPVSDRWLAYPNPFRDRVMLRALAASSHENAVASNTNERDAQARNARAPSGRTPNAALPTVHDAAGRTVRALPRYRVGIDLVWDGRDDMGRPLPDGLYWIAIPGEASVKVLRVH
jgi:hypothetical protein